MAALVVLGGGSEHQHSRHEEQEDQQDDTAAQHSHPDQSRIAAGLIRDPWRLGATGRTRRRIVSDRRLTESAPGECGWCFAHAASSYFTNTHSGLSSGNAMSPMIAVAATSRGLLTFQRKRTTRLASATSTVSQSPMAIFPSSTQAPRMVPIAAAYAPLMKPCTFGFVR